MVNSNTLTEPDVSLAALRLLLPVAVPSEADLVMPGCTKHRFKLQGSIEREGNEGISTCSLLLWGQYLTVNKCYLYR